MNSKALTLSLVTSLAALTNTALAQPAFYPIGNPDGLISEVYELARDGKAAAGSNLQPSGISELSFRWTLLDGRQDFQTPIFNANSRSGAFGISADGSTVVGSAISPASGIENEAYRRRSDGTVQLLGHLPNFPGQGSALAVSADGSVVVGYAQRSGSGGNPIANPFRWTQSGGMQPLTGLPAGNYSFAHDVSDDGKTVVGTYDADSTGSPTRAFIWHEGSGATFLTGPTGVDRGEAYAVSANGSVVAGVAPGLGGCRWVNEIAQGLGLVGDWGSARPSGISDDGSVVVGQLFSSPTHPGFSTFVWTEDTGMMESVDYLKLLGVPLPSDLLGVTVMCVSGDGLSFGGTVAALSLPDGGSGCIATIPAPGVPLVGSLVAFVLFHRKR